MESRSHGGSPYQNASPNPETAAGDLPASNWPNQPHGRYFDEARATELKGTIPGGRLLWALLFAPTRFMLSHAVHVKFSQVFVLMWFVGMIQVIDQLEWRSLGSGSQVSRILNTWPEIWGAAMAGGVVRGLIYYWLLGLWFRARLHMCGVRRVDSGVAGRVFAFLHFPALLVGFCYYAVASLVFSDFTSYSESDHIGWIIASVLPAVAAIYGSVLAYASVRGVFNANRFWAIIWFLFLPIVLRIGVLGGAVVIAWMLNAAPKPDLDAPKSASTTTMTVRYPGNWVLTRGEPDTGPERLIELQPTGHDALIAMEILYYDADADPIAETEAWLKELGFELFADPRPLTSWGAFVGEGFEYRSAKDGQEYVLRMFFSGLAHGGTVEFREIIHADSAERLEPGLELVRESMVVRDPATLRADVNGAKALEAGGVRFRAPGNWWLTRWVEQNTEPGVPANFSLRAESGQLSVLSILGYRESQGARSELGRTLANLGITGRMEDERPLDRWMGLEGLGIEGIDRAKTLGERDRHIRLIVSEREDGTFVEVLRVEYLDTASLTTPGFELMESTFEVDPRAPVTAPAEEAATD